MFLHVCCMYVAWHDYNIVYHLSDDTWILDTGIFTEKSKWFVAFI